MEFYKIRAQGETSEQPVRFRYETVEISTNTTKGLLPINISDKYSRKILMSKKDKRPSVFFSNEKFIYWDVWKENIVLNVSAWSTEDNNTNVIKIPSTEDRLQTMRAIFEPFIFKTAYKNVS